MFQFQKTIRQSKSRKEKQERARERERREEESQSKSKCPVQRRKPLKDRNYRVDLESRLGKTQLVVTPVVAPGYYYSVCVCVVKDLANYLDHINGVYVYSVMGFRPN